MIIKLFDKMISAKSTSRLSNAIKPTPFGIFSSSFHSNNKPTLKTDSVYMLRDITNLDDAVNVFDQMLQRKPMASVGYFNKLFSIVVGMNHFEQVIIMFKELCLLDRPVDEFSMATVVNCYCKLREVDSGFGVFATSLKMGFPPNYAIIGCLIKGLLVQGRAPEAARLFGMVIEYKLCELHEITFSAVLDGLCKSGRVVNAVKLLEDMEYEHCTLSKFGYTVVIDGLCKSRKVNDAMDLLSKMIGRGYQPDVVTYTALIRGLCYFSRMDEANMLLKRMIDEGVYPNVRTFTTLVASYSKDGRIEDAEDVVQNMEEWGVQPDLFTYNALINGYCLMGQPDKAMKVMNFMVKKGLKPCVISYDIIIRGFCKQKQFDHAWKLFNEMPHKGLKPSESVYDTIIVGLDSVGRDSEAFELYNEKKIVCGIWDS